MNRAEQIIIVTPSWDTPRGNSTTARRLAQGYHQLGFQVEVVSLEDAAWTKKWLQLIDLAREKQKQVIYHVLHANTLRQLKENGLPACKKRGHVLLTLTGTDLAALRQDSDAGFSKCLKEAEAFVVFDQEQQLFLQKLFPAWQNRIFTIPQGVTILPEGDCPGKDGPQLPKQCVLLPAGIRPVKDILFAVEAFSLVYRRGWPGELWIIGPVLDQSYYAQVVAAVGAVPNITLAGELPLSMMPGVFRQGAIVVNTSLHEGQPQSAMEGMSMGLPALLRKTNGNIGLLEDGVQGYYFENSQQLAEQVRQLLTDENLRQRMGRAAAALARRAWSAQRELSAYLRIIQQLSFQQNMGGKA